MKKPNLFLIGGAKCGTTSMASYLSQHPQVFWSDPKELWYFCRPDFPHKSGEPLSEDQYLNHFTRSTSQHIYLAEGSVSYLYAEGAVQRILEFNSSAKFIVMIRNPLEAIFSLHRQMLMNMQESEPDFEKAWRLQGERRIGKKVPMKCQNSRYLLYKDWCLWGKQLEHVYQVAGEENVCVLLFDDFKRNPKREYERVLSFLGLNSDDRFEFPVENKGKSYRNQKLVNVLDSLLVLGSRVRTALGLSYSIPFIVRLVSKIKGRQLTEVSQNRLSNEVRHELEEAFRSDIELLSRLLGRDLTDWLDSRG